MSFVFRPHTVLNEESDNSTLRVDHTDPTALLKCISVAQLRQQKLFVSSKTTNDKDVPDGGGMLIGLLSAIVASHNMFVLKTHSLSPTLQQDDGLAQKSDDDTVAPPAITTSVTGNATVRDLPTTSVATATASSSNTIMWELSARMDSWMGFSLNGSCALEEAYQQFLKNPADTFEFRLQFDTGEFLVDF